MRSSEKFASLSIEPDMSIREARRRLILTTLAHFDGERAATARELGMSLDDLYAQLREYGYTRVDDQEQSGLSFG